MSINEDLNTILIQQLDFKNTSLPFLFQPSLSSNKNTSFLKHSTLGEELQQQWEYLRVLTDPEAILNWYLHFSKIFQKNSLNWLISSLNDNDDDDNDNKPRNSYKKNDKKIIILTESSTKIQPKNKLKRIESILRFKFKSNSNIIEEKDEKMNQLISHPPKFIMLTIRVLYYLMNLLNKNLLKSYELKSQFLK
ncbi:hypothetical protein M0813_20624 [Anaeramoeba flamelloides]|uniref:Uncharacterized protein n=1 Tax=Anaeramoeba flamelloides TaxID=1746091 RepID=A0ABQ8YKG0_9EUKA|nr:hypothetical protein M0813_20624 [Anaeramoeba flamelloides]